MTELCAKGLHVKTPESMYSNGRCKECKKEYDGRSLVRERKNLLSRQRYSGVRKTRQRSACAAWYASNKTAKSEYGKKWYNANRYSRHNISQEAFDHLLNQQDGACAICKDDFSDENKPQVDHDHSCCSGHYSCGACVRSLLCGKCNKGLGLFKDSAVVLANATQYLLRKGTYQ